MSKTKSFSLKPSILEYINAWSLSLALVSLENTILFFPGVQIKPDMVLFTSTLSRLFVLKFFDNLHAPALIDGGEGD